MSRDFRMDLSPATAGRRLEFWRSVSAAIHTSEFMGSLRGEPEPSDSVSLSFWSVVQANIRLAEAQLRSATAEEPKS